VARERILIIHRLRSELGNWSHGGRGEENRRENLNELQTIMQLSSEIRNGIVSF
jgi:hypothetical protein